MPLPLATATLIASGLGLGGSLLNGLQSRANVRDTNRASREMANLQYRNDLDMWNRQNAYNSPQAQMERLKAAGLNPNLIYGNGTAVGNTSSPPPKYNAPTIDYSGRQPIADPTAVLGAYQDFQLKQAQIDNVKAQTQRTIADTGLYPFRQEALRYGNLKEQDLWLKQETNPYKVRIAGHQADAAQYLSQKMQAGIASTMAGTINQRAKTENVYADTLFKQYRNNWMQMGITTSDNIAFRVISRMFQESGINPVQIGGQIFKPKR